MTLHVTFEFVCFNHDNTIMILCIRNNALVCVLWRHGVVVLLLAEHLVDPVQQRNKRARSTEQSLATQYGVASPLDGIVGIDMVAVKWSMQCIPTAKGAVQLANRRSPLCHAPSSFSCTNEPAVVHHRARDGACGQPIYVLSLS